MTKEEIINAMAEIKEQMREAVDNAETQKRSLDETEQAEFEQKRAKLDEYKAQLTKIENEEQRALETEKQVETNTDQNKTNIRNMKNYKEMLAEQIQAVANSRSVDEYENVTGNTISLRANESLHTDSSAMQGEYSLDILEPLQNALLFDKLGIKVINTAKAVTIPSVNNVTMTIEGEISGLTGQKVAFSKAKVAPFRVGISMPFSNTAIKECDVDLVNYAIELGGKAEAQLINNLACSPVGVTGDGTTHKGPFVDALTDASVCAKVSWANVVGLQADVAGANVAFDDTAAYVMSPATEAKLKTIAVAKKDIGSGKFIIEDGTVDGYPYLVSNACRTLDASGNVSEDYIGFGVFSNLMLQRVGGTDLVIDNLSRSKENITEVNINDNVVIQVLRPEAFSAIKLDASAWV